ncbi:MAG: PP2C family protein-serine/threonine phosphatase [Longimicrobiales bacterium]
MSQDSTTVIMRPDLGIKLSVGAASHPGRARENNQDSLLVADLERAGETDGLLLQSERDPGEFMESGEFDLGVRGAVLLVADGMGGAVGGATASGLTRECVRDVLIDAWVNDATLSADQFVHYLAEALRRSNASIRRHAVEHPHLDGMGTTATAVGVLADTLYIAQVGDSRAYLVRDGEVAQLTRDQSLVQQLVESGVAREKAEESSHRHVLLQALGTQPGILVDVTHQQLRDGDVVVVCSDGLSNQVRAPEIARILGVTPNPSVACQSLISLANERGGPDNITLVMCAFSGSGLEPSGEGDHVGYTPHPAAQSPFDAVPGDATVRIPR